MNILKNKHLVLAMFVAPILAIIAYFATDHAVSEKPHQAQQGNSYRLAAKSNCRYQSGQCTLENGDIEVVINIERLKETMIELTLHTNMPADKVLASFAGDSETGQPVAMQNTPAQNKVWNAKFNVKDPAQSQLRLVIELAGSLFYAETPAIFMDYSTTYSRDNFSN